MGQVAFLFQSDMQKRTKNTTKAKSKYFLSVVIPCHNEEKKIAKDVQEAYKFATREGWDIEVLVVDDGSVDHTAGVVKELQKQYSSLRLLSEKTNHGKGYALKKGIMEARGEYILFADAGYCVPFKDVKKGMELLENGIDVATGSRALELSTIKRKQSWYRQIGAKLFWIILKLFIGLPQSIRDTQCGFKVFPQEIAKSLFKDAFTEGFMIDIEVLLRAKKLGYKIEEFPVTWSSDADTRFKVFSGMMRNFKELFKIKRELNKKD